MLSSTVRRSLLSLLAVSTVGTLGFSAAATLGVEGTDLGAGSSVIASCAPDPGDVSVGAFVTAYVPGPPAGFEVSGLSIDVPAACATQDAKVVLVDALSANIGEGTKAGLTSGANTVTLTSNASAKDVVGIHIVISEPLAP